MATYNIKNKEMCQGNECPGGSPLQSQKEKPLALPLNQIHIF